METAKKKNISKEKALELLEKAKAKKEEKAKADGEAPAAEDTQESRVNLENKGEDIPVTLNKNIENAYNNQPIIQQNEVPRDNNSGMVNPQQPPPVESQEIFPKALQQNEVPRDNNPDMANPLVESQKILPNADNNVPSESSGNYNAIHKQEEEYEGPPRMSVSNINEQVKDNGQTDIPVVENQHIENSKVPKKIKNMIIIYPTCQKAISRIEKLKN